MGNDKADDKPAAQGKKPFSHKKRGYSDFFAWPVDRQLEEWAIVDTLKESLEKANAGFFHSVVARGRGNDPPDCEAMLMDGGKLGIEVTELVDSQAILAYLKGDTQQQAEWSKDKLISAITQRLAVKDLPHHVNGGPYDLYVLVIHTDEPALSFDYMNPLVENLAFKSYSLIDRAFLLMSYDERYAGCPYIELNIKAKSSAR